MNEKEQLEIRHVELVKILKAFEALELSQEWETLKEMVFNKAKTSLEKQLVLEAKKPVLDEPKIYRLQGELSWAEKYCDISKFIESNKRLLEEVNKKIK